MSFFIFKDANILFQELLTHTRSIMKAEDKLLLLLAHEPDMFTDISIIKRVASIKKIYDEAADR